MLPKHFSSLAANPESTKFFEQSALKKRIEEGEFYAKSKSDEIKASIEGILPALLKGIGFKRLVCVGMRVKNL